MKRGGDFLIRDVRAEKRGANREGVTNRGIEQKAGKIGEVKGASSSVLIRVHPWLLPRGASRERIHSCPLACLRGWSALVRIFREFHGPPRGASR